MVASAFINRDAQIRSIWSAQASCGFLVSTARIAVPVSLVAADGAGGGACRAWRAGRLLRAGQGLQAGRLRA
jgi:hypothetical protein